ncbi:MAG: carboxypeptidase regulatory-like domain-containing protein [Terriglobales bacterium]
MKLCAKIGAISLLLWLGTIASAQTLTGTLQNGTTGKAAGGDEVVLIKLGQGMEEAARTKADASGHFSFKLPDPGPHLIRAIHQGVTYHRMAPPGTTSVELLVYDVSKKSAGVSVTADVMRFQAQGSELQGIRLFAVDNNSNPPRTQMGDEHFEFFLPAGAQIDEAMAMTAGGQPIKSAPVPEKEKDCYGFVFPLRPGETQFQVIFHLPYSGELSIDPKPLYGAQHFVVMVPKTMQFTSAPGADFKAMKDPRQSDAVVQVASNTQVGQPLTFKISGTGTLGEAGDDSQGSPTPVEGGAATAGRDTRPGGGLGPPIDAPDPLEKYRWYILGGFAAALAAGGVFITNRSRTAAVPDFGASDIQLPEPPARPPASDRSGLLLEALKDELFQLEVEHKQGGISQQEYERARAALDQTLERALKRAALK